ncbi:MAG: T9SS type A sorting domain-containing protein [Flavobacteriales bacterium]|nr:T9SS type A sorting domain-containing protein [Flavobacteriales bacterium]
MLRNHLLPALGLLLPLMAFGQTAQEKPTLNALGQAITVAKATRFMKTPPMTEWPVVREDGAEDRERHEADKQRALPVVTDARWENEPDGALQLRSATKSAKAPAVNVNGQSGSGIPPDPTGAAGPDHYVQAVNSSYRVYTKTGPGLGPQHSLSSLWADAGNDGDPIVMYDRHADRWFISQFDEVFSGPPYQLVIAVSATSDPAGAYYAYEFNINQFPDYPKYSIWWDGYYCTTNSSRTAIVFERTKMLAGDPDARMIALSASGVIDSGFTSVLPSDADGDLPPAGTPCYFFNLEDNSWGAPSDRIKIYAMTTDWVTTANTNVAQHQTIDTAPFDPWIGTGWDNIAQPGTAQKLDGGLGIFNFRAQHIRWTNYNTLMLCHGVDVGSNQCGIRWYELRDANDGNWAIHQQGTYSPDGADRFYGSIAMDMQGNIGLGYSCADGPNGIYAGLRYTGRMANDPLGQMTFIEQEVVAGLGSQQSLNRFGDYAHCSLDPDGHTFWFTGEYLGTNGATRTRIFSFDLSAEVGVEENVGQEAFALEAVQQGDAIQVQVLGADAATTSVLELIGLDGKRVLIKELATASGRATTRIDISSIAQGIWFIRAINGEQQRVQRIVLTPTK